MATSDRLFTAIQQVAMPYAGSLAINAGDLVYFDGTTIKAVSSYADQGTYAQNKRGLAPQFAGVAGESKLSTSAAGTINVIVDSIFEFDCVSAAYAPGDLVGPSDVGSGASLSATSLTEVTDPREAIGHVTKNHASGTTRVQCRLISRIHPNSVPALRFDAGEVTLDGSNPTPVTTRLTTVLGGVATIKSTSALGDDPSQITVGFTGSDATLNIYAWKNTGGTDPTLIASTDNTFVIEWVAWGY